MNVVIPPTVEPVTLEDARLHCRVDAEGSPPAHIDDPLLERLVSSVREWTESYLGRALAPQTIEVSSLEFPSSYFEVSFGEVLGIESLTYVDELGADVVLDPGFYTLNNETYPVRLQLNDGFQWPTVSTTVVNPIRVRYVVGYSTPGTSPQDAPLPASIKSAMLLLVAYLYKNRESASVLNLVQIPMGVKFLLAPYKLSRGFA